MASLSISGTAYTKVPIATSQTSVIFQSTTRDGGWYVVAASTPAADTPGIRFDRLKTVSLTGLNGGTLDVYVKAAAPPERPPALIWFEGVSES